MTETAPVSVPDNPDTPLWRFAVQFWQIPGVEQECLALQARGWHITRLLGACWLAQCGIACPEGKNKPLDDWHKAVTRKLREARKQIDRHNPALATVRSAIARAELEAEQIELALIYQSAGQPAGLPEAPEPDPTLFARNLRVAAPESTTDNELASLTARFTRYMSAQHTGERTP